MARLKRAWGPGDSTGLRVNQPYNQSQLGMLLAARIRKFDYKKLNRGFLTKEECQKYGQVKVSSWPLLSHFAKVMDERQPDCLVTVDYPGFNMKLAKLAHEKGIPVVSSHTESLFL